MKKIDKLELIWQTIFIVIPALIFMRLNDYFADNSTLKIILSGLFGGIGAALGGGIYGLVNKKSITVKVTTLFFLTGICILIFIGIIKWSQPSYLTCDICGYKSLEEKKQECDVCGNVSWNLEIKEGTYSNRSEWVREEQLMWFGFDDSVNFLFTSKGRQI